MDSVPLLVKKTFFRPEIGAIETNFSASLTAPSDDFADLFI
jgi:hypothetical protein